MCCQQVPPQAGPDEREGPLHRVASFFDQLLGQAARFLSSGRDQSGMRLWCQEHLMTSCLLAAPACPPVWLCSKMVQSEQHSE